MTNATARADEPAPIKACTVCRDVQDFDLLIEDMEAELGEAWGDLSYQDATVFLTQPESADLMFIAVAMNEEDEKDVAVIVDLITTAAERDVDVIVIAEEVSPMVLHQLLKLGAKEFVPYPLPEGALHEAIERLRAPGPAPAPAEADGSAKVTSLKPSGDREGVIMPVHALAGGTGASTFAVNLAWELANISQETAPRVCLLDFDLQLGAISTYLDLPQREAVFELLTNTDTMDSESFMQALQPYEDKLHVLTAPIDMLPLDLLTPEDIERILDMAAANFDYVIVDMPSTVVMWTETVLAKSAVYFTLMELDMRSAQNALRMIRALKAEDLPVEKLRFVLNRAPRFTDLAGKSRLRRLSESLDISFEVQLPDGGKPVTEANDQGTPLAEAARKNPLRKEIQKLAQSAHALNQKAATKS